MSYKRENKKERVHAMQLDKRKESLKTGKEEVKLPVFLQI